MNVRRSVFAAAAGSALALLILLWGRPEPESATETVAAVASETKEPTIDTEDARSAGEDTDAAPPPNTIMTPATDVARPEPHQIRSTLPGRTPALPMVQLLRTAKDLPPLLAANEREFTEGEQLFAEESVDTEWAPAAEAEIFGRFAQQAGLKLFNLQVECRSTMCRVQMTQPSTPDEADRPQRLLNTLGLELRWIVSLNDPPSSLSSVAYLWRPGLAPASRPPGQNVAGDE